MKKLIPVLVGAALFNLLIGAYVFLYQKLGWLGLGIVTLTLGHFLAGFFAYRFFAGGWGVQPGMKDLLFKTLLGLLCFGLGYIALIFMMILIEFSPIKFTGPGALKSS